MPPQLPLAAAHNGGFVALGYVDDDPAAAGFVFGFLGIRDYHFRHHSHMLAVREPLEWEIAHLDGATLMPVAQVPNRVNELSTADEIVVYCKTGVRSARITNFLREMGFRKVKNLEGGIVSAILVHEGDTVDKGQVLLKIDNTSAASDYHETRARYLSISAVVSRLEAEVAAYRSLGAEARAFRGGP